MPLLRRPSYLSIAYSSFLPTVLPSAPFFLLMDHVRLATIHKKDPLVSPLKSTLFPFPASGIDGRITGHIACARDCPCPPLPSAPFLIFSHLWQATATSLNRRAAEECLIHSQPSCSHLPSHASLVYDPLIIVSTPPPPPRLRRALLPFVSVRVKIDSSSFISLGFVGDNDTAFLH